MMWLWIGCLRPLGGNFAVLEFVFKVLDCPEDWICYLSDGNFYDQPQEPLKKLNHFMFTTHAIWELRISYRCEFNEQSGHCWCTFSVFLFCFNGKWVAWCSSGGLVWHHQDDDCALGRLSLCSWQQRNQAEWQVGPFDLLCLMFILYQEADRRDKWIFTFSGVWFLFLVDWSVGLVGIFVDPHDFVGRRSLKPIER